RYGPRRLCRAGAAHRPNLGSGSELFRRPDLGNARTLRRRGADRSRPRTSQAPAAGPATDNGAADGSLSGTTEQLREHEASGASVCAWATVRRTDPKSVA